MKARLEEVIVSEALAIGGRYYACKCGRSWVAGFVQPPPCRGCPHCGTLLSASPALCTPVIPHDTYSEEMVISEDGRSMPVEVCRFCTAIRPASDRSFLRA